MFYGSMLGALFLQTLVFCVILCDGSNQDSRQKEFDKRDNVVLGVYVIIDPSIGNATEAGYINYTSSLLGGVNIKFWKIKKPVIKLGLIGLYVLNDTEVNEMLPLNNDNHLELRSTWKSLLGFKARNETANISDVLYVLTKKKIFSSTKPPEILSGAASIRGVCSDDNIAVGNDVFGTYLGMDIFAKNMARVLGAWSHECYQNYSGVFDDCHQRQLLSTLRRAWPYCSQHNTIDTTWMSGYHLPGEYFNYSAYCQGKGNETVQLEECEQEKKQQECRLCCSTTTLKEVIYYDAPDGTLCENKTKGCLDKKCEVPHYKFMQAAHPGHTQRVNFNETTTTATG
ncbi:uncharacterized protein LOC135391806 [Ornithodoros turicata]|uniref:uncharacterized protein LOC135391806 n=1 Tax=Ornithodoros turicata TaxID=34597 RepID=UPI003138B3B0